MIDKNNYGKWIIGTVVVLIIIGVIIIIRSAKKQKDALNVSTDPITGKPVATNSTTTGSTSVYVFSALTINPINKLDLYNSYPNDIAYSISVPSYPLGVVLDLQGASNFMKIVNSKGQVLQVRKTGIYTL